MPHNLGVNGLHKFGCARLGFFYFTEARAGPQRAGVVAKPSEGWEKECDGDWAMAPGAGNPAFPRAIPLAMLVFD